jgi:hypothetical protein
MEPLVFESLEPIEIPVKIASKDYVLREAGEAFASKYQNALMRSTKVVEGTDGNKSATVEGISDTEALLVSLCLFEVGQNNSKVSVNVNTIRTWPHRVVKPLFQKAEEISGLGANETEEILRKRLKDTQDKLNKLVLSKPSSNGTTPQHEHSSEDAVKN